MLRHTTPSVFFERVEEVRSNCRYLNSYAFCPSAIDVNGLNLPALYTSPDGLPRDAASIHGPEHLHVTSGRALHTTRPQLALATNAPRRASCDAPSGTEATVA